MISCCDCKKDNGNNKSCKMLTARKSSRAVPCAVLSRLVPKNRIEDSHWEYLVGNQIRDGFRQTVVCNHEYSVDDIIKNVCSLQVGFPPSTRFDIFPSDRQGRDRRD
jgi:hypothetical protein